MIVDPARGSLQDTASALEVKHLVVRYQARGRMLHRPPSTVAVNDVSFRVEAAELVALVGESGSGKTSVAQAVLGLQSDWRGHVRIGGLDLAEARSREMRELRRRVQVVYQDPYESMDPRFSVERTVAEGLVVHRLADKRERRRRVEAALEAVDLRPAAAFMGRYPHQLSGGQRQRVAIAAALILEPELLVADEPVSMLDVTVRAGILDLLARLRRERRLGILMITHDLSTAAHYADRILVMYGGRIVEQGSVHDVIEDPAHPYTKALLTAVPTLESAFDRTGSDRPRHRPRAATSEGCGYLAHCPVAQPRCATIVPSLWDVRNTGEHTAACVLVEGAPDA